MYGTILADPAWPYVSGGPVGTGGRGRVPGTEELVQVSASKQYPLMSVDAIKSLKVREVAEKNAHLYLWTTNSFVVEAHEVAKAWGFEPKTLITWGKTHKNDRDKASMKTGYYFRSATEHCLFAVRGSLRLKGPCRPTLFLSERLPHSVKPDWMYELIEEQSPGPYLEMFARRTRLGWATWGNELPNAVEL